MIRNTANVSFYCRESKKNKDGVATGMEMPFSFPF